MKNSEKFKLPNYPLIYFFLITILNFPLFAQNLEIHYINVQQGSSTLIKGPDGTLLLFDGGKGGKGDAEIIPYLQSIGISTSTALDYVVVSHRDTDHYAGLTEVLAAGYDALNVYDNGSTKTASSYDSFISEVNGTTASDVTAIALGDVIQLGNGATATCVVANGAVLGVGAISGGQDNENDRSVGLLIQYGDFDFIIAGDLGGGDSDNSCTGRSTGQINMETPMVQAIMPGGAAPLLSSFGVEVANINHHGSESSTNPDYMNLLTPTVVCIPVGPGQGSNWYHPRVDVVEKVALAQASCVNADPATLVLQTEDDDSPGSTTSMMGYAVGDIIITTDGVATYTLNATGAVSQGAEESAAAGLPRVFNFEESGPVGDNPPVILSVTRTPLEPISGEDLTIEANITDEGPVTATLHYDLDGVPQSSLAMSNTGGTFSATILGQAEGVIIDYYVRAVDDISQSSTSSTTNVTIGSGTPPPTGSSLVLSEVFYDASGSDNNYEWIELFNSGSEAIDLSNYSLGSGGSNYTYSTVQLSGTIAPCETFVVGGTRSTSTNANPSYDQKYNFSPDIQNSGSTADGIALFDVPSSQITGSTIPVDAVIYGGSNGSGLIDETGNASVPEVGDASAGKSIERIDLNGSWQIQNNPTPNTSSLLCQ